MWLRSVRIACIGLVFIVPLVITCATIAHESNSLVPKHVTSQSHGRQLGSQYVQALRMCRDVYREAREGKLGGLDYTRFPRHRRTHGCAPLPVLRGAGHLRGVGGSTGRLRSTSGGAAKRGGMRGPL